MFTNPYLEGLLAVLVGAGLMVLAHVYAMPDIGALGTSVSILGLGYMSGHAVAGTPLRG